MHPVPAFGYPYSVKKFANISSKILYEPGYKLREKKNIIRYVMCKQ